MNRRAFLATMTSVTALTRSPGTRGQSADPVRVGVHLDSAKQASYYSLLQRDAIDRFITELNGSGGVLGTRLEVLYEDDENNPVTTVTKVDKLAAAGVSAIVSIGSSATGLAAQAVRRSCTSQSAPG